ncbi:hypothetical protein DMUE_2608 [Dictyocoela muelleri]|nr:hypothetical protein DMUE_2608 [Dictyocoela muelleri]
MDDNTDFESAINFTRSTKKNKIKWKYRVLDKRSDILIKVKNCLKRFNKEEYAVEISQILLGKKFTKAISMERKIISVTYFILHKKGFPVILHDFYKNNRDKNKIRKILFDNFIPVMKSSKYLKSLIDRVYVHLKKYGCVFLRSKEEIYDFLISNRQYRCVECIIVLFIGPLKYIESVYEQYKLNTFSDILSLKYIMKKIFSGIENKSENKNKKYDGFMNMCVKKLLNSGFTIEEIFKMSKKDKIFCALQNCEKNELLLDK